MIVQLGSFDPSGARHTSHKPAKAKGWCDLSVMYIGVLVPSGDFFHSKNPDAGTRHRRRRSALRNAGLSANVSTRALIMRLPMEGSSAQLGIKPQRKKSIWFLPSLGTTAIACDGAML
jgi:hypothetical protein